LKSSPWNVFQEVALLEESLRTTAPQRNRQNFKESILRTRSNNPWNRVLGISRTVVNHPSLPVAGNEQNFKESIFQALLQTNPWNRVLKISFRSAAGGKGSVKRPGLAAHPECENARNFRESF
jgi:hypothetical protein